MSERTPGEARIGPLMVDERVENHDLVLLVEIDDLVEIKRKLDLDTAGRPQLAVVTLEEALDEPLLGAWSILESVDLVVRRVRCLDARNHESHRDHEHIAHSTCDH